MNYLVELRNTFRFISRYPQLIIPALGPGLLVAWAIQLSWTGRFFWVSRLLQRGISLALFLGGLFLALLVLGFIVAIAWDYQYRGGIDWRRGIALVARNMSQTALAAAILALLVGFFSLWFIFTGFLFGFLLMFTIPSVVIDGDDLFTGMKSSFQMAIENLAENFVFGIISVVVLLAGYLLTLVFGFIPGAGLVLSAILLAGVLTYLSIFLGRYYLSLTRY